ncbi:branched-chain amino acid transport system permease protein [Modestobacter sp. DSM 44400]|uniref:branched-chain amino acid ABC transporter permease n=1 Tax=Modestobacter sp. DSM 44400 TaxID=1550230 RepID=UPI000899680B|nr:branched-chain amino acid ABC transporter permease [Modestobacter sp. DSM 44400]SDY62421.1 branched-chain amino acid transport system permease protein [Modestobacter sp. DSM 44400]
MSDVVTSSPAAASSPAAPTGAVTADGRGGRTAGTVFKAVVWAALLVVLLALPLYVNEFWLRTGFVVFGAIVGAIGLNLLVGTTGQLSLAHAFFLAVGATTYTYLSGSPGGFTTKVGGLALPPVVGGLLAVLAAGIAGLLFSPLAARLRGIYLGVASLGLVFIGEHVLNTWTSVTGGFNGRSAPGFSFFGFSFSDADKPYLAVLGVPFGQSERLWYLGLALAAVSYVFARNLIRSRPGRAMQTLRDSEVAAAVMGVNVQAYKARAFFVSSMYAGLSGVMFALSVGSIAPESFSLAVSVQFLAMIVLGGLGSVGGAALGAVMVAALPLVFQQYADSLPFVAGVGEGGIVAGEAARFLYGAAVILILLFQPSGLAGLPQRFRRPRRPAGEVTAFTPGEPAQGAAPAQKTEDRPTQSS